MLTLSYNQRLHREKEIVNVLLAYDGMRKSIFNYEEKDKEANILGHDFISTSSVPSPGIFCGVLNEVNLIR